MNVQQSADLNWAERLPDLKCTGQMIESYFWYIYMVEITLLAFICIKIFMFYKALLQGSGAKPLPWDAVKQHIDTIAKWVQQKYLVSIRRKGEM